MLYKNLGLNWEAFSGFKTKTKTNKKLVESVSIKHEINNTPSALSLNLRN